MTQKSCRIYYYIERRVMMHRVILITLLFLLTLLSADGYKELKELYADLDGDGISEKITWKKFTATELGDYYQIIVRDKSGNIIWRGPKTTDASSPFYIASLDTGVSIPELIADIDNDGYKEMLIPTPASDVTPLWYNRLKWKNGKFIPMQSAILQYDPYAKDIPLKWVYKYPGAYSFWTMMFRRDKNRVKASITGLYPDGSSDYGEVYLHFLKGGAMIDSWIKPLHGHKRDKVKFSYIAKLSARDHYNSQGEKLKRVVDIIRQDRVNFYKGKKDLEDRSDPVFIDSFERESLSEYKVYLHGISRDAIINQTPTVKVKVDVNYGKLDIYKAASSNSSKIEYSYIAKISNKDKYNSRGVRLKTLKEILRQDRAYVHKNRADSEDTYDHYFTTIKERAKMQNYKIVPIGTSYRELKREILYGNPLLGVQVGDGVLRIKIIQP